MNNDQFRRLVGANSNKASSNSQNGAPSTARSAAAPALGSRLKSSIPMTPRSIGGNTQNLFAKQLAERDQSNQAQKRSRTSAPKGSKLAQGYVDRAKLRHEQEEKARDEKRDALEKAFADGEIDEDTYKARRDEIAAAANSRTKGLDFDLLAKARRGESTEEPEQPALEQGDEPAQGGENEGEFDDALEQFESADIQAVAKEKVKKKGQLATKPLVPGMKRTRDQILAELKAAREAAKAKEESALGSKFKKIGAQKTPGTRFERDSKGREVMIVVDEDGHEKRKVRKLAADDSEERAAFIPDKNSEVLGMEVPEFYKKKQEKEKAKQDEDEDDDIFNDVGDYNPLAGVDSDSDDDSSDEDGAVSENDTGAKAGKKDTAGGVEPKKLTDTKLEASPGQPDTAAAPSRVDYFKGSKTGLVSEESRKTSAASDPAVLAALRKAKALNAEAKSEEEQQNAAREERLKKLMEDSKRDAEDMDMGFGTSRMADEEDLEERTVKLSAWGKDDDDDGKSGDKTKRKRGGKKRKGDVNSAADVLQAMERQKAANK